MVIIATLQFTVILDFMVLSPLGAILMDELKISPKEFGIVVSAYAISAGISGLLAAGFADKYDRKKLLLFFYSGFLLGTVLCAVAPNFEFLLMARIVTGIFGGVIGSIGFAIITDLFKLEVRGRVMGVVQTAFAASQVFGIPVGLWLATKFNWHFCFWMIVAFEVIVGVLIIFYMKPINAHLAINDHLAIDEHLVTDGQPAIKRKRNAWTHLANTVRNPDYTKAFVGTILLATGGFMLMPFGSKFSTENLGLTMDQVTILYLCTGASSIIFGPFMGKLSDKVGRYPVFLGGTILGIIMVAFYTRLGITPLWMCIVLNIVLFIGINARMISSSTLISAIPNPADRGAFMSVNSSIQQISGGIAATVAGLIVATDATGKLLRYDVLGYVVIASMIAAAFFIFRLDKFVKQKLQGNAAQSQAKATAKPEPATAAR